MQESLQGLEKVVKGGQRKRKIEMELDIAIYFLENFLMFLFFPYFTRRILYN
jgi:hypothetical protein